MAGSLEILTAIRELTNTKQLDRTELHGLLFDGITAALAKKHGPTVQAEVDIDEDKGTIRIVRLRTVVAEVTDAAREVSLEDGLDHIHNRRLDRPISNRGDSQRSCLVRTGFGNMSATDGLWCIRPRLQAVRQLPKILWHLLGEFCRRDVVDPSRPLVANHLLAGGQQVPF